NFAEITACLRLFLHLYAFKVYFTKKGFIFSQTVRLELALQESVAMAEIRLTLRYHCALSVTTPCVY
ncbi:MAG: hypothetical protein E7H57_20580, partial [Pantoea sp.]|nr:hypothetical protein [Pantoea sp.]